MLQRQKRQKSTSFIVKTPFKSIAEHRKVKNYNEKWTSKKLKSRKSTKIYRRNPFNSTADTRKIRELPRKMNIEEVEEPETTKIYRQNPRPTRRPPRKLRKFTDETNMQARNHENSDEFCTEPRPPPRSSHPGFLYRKNRKCYHTVWGINHIIFIVHLSTNLPEDLVERWKGRRKSSTICGTLGWGIHLEKKTLGIEPATTAVRIPTNCRLLKKSWIFEFVLMKSESESWQQKLSRKRPQTVSKQK